MKKIIILSSILISLFSNLFATSAKYSDENYTLDFEYNDIIIPGDAIFARMKITTPKSHKKLKTENERKAVLQLYNDKKVIESSPFYTISKKKNTTTIEMLSGLPISTWITEGNFSLKVVFNLGDDDKDKEFTLPITFQSREFNQEDIPLDQKNTEIRSDNSPQRAKQIEKLNNILFTSMPDDVYNLKAFTYPTESKRYTAYFGDRRKYIYSNGKSSTSLHYGNDLGIPEGSSVTSCAEGRVVMAENRITTGYSIVIEHLPGLYSLYYHLSEMKVQEGDYVKQGQLIGKSGSTGLATGPHLHWEIRLNGSAVRPEFFVKNFTFEEL